MEDAFYIVHEREYIIELLDLITALNKASKHSETKYQNIKSKENKLFN